MDDLISRQAVLDGLASIAKGKAKSDAQKSLMGRVMFFTEQLPSVQPDISEYSDRLWKLAYERGKRDVQPQRWIPVSEALPKDDEEVIVTCLDDSGDTPFSYTTVAWHYKGMWVCENERCPFVIAWMPLPPSYKGGQE